MFGWLWDGVGWVRDLSEDLTRPITDLGEYIIKAAVDWGIETAKDQAFDKTEEFKNHVKELTLQYYDSLVLDAGDLKSPFGGLAAKFRRTHYIIIGTSLAAGLGTEYWVHRRKDYSWVRGLMWGLVFYAATAASIEMSAGQLILDKLPLQDIDLDTDELRRKLEEFLEDAAFWTSFPDM